MSIEILKAGILDTIQDGGRYGYQHFGINPGGAMDIIASGIANVLVGNDKNAPVIELHFPASVFKFRDNHLIAISGADFEPEIDGNSVPLNTSILVSKNSTLRFSNYKKGARTFLAIEGEWSLNTWLDSYSTNLKALAGGHKGRALKKDDVINVEMKSPLESSDHTTVILPISAEYPSLPESENIIRYIAGNEFDWLTKNAKTTFNNSAFSVTSQSDRMGFRLKGESLQNKSDRQLLSSAVVRGTIQLLPTGQLVVLMADHQTTGGYPKIAQVITADFSKLAQVRPNENIRFKCVSLEEAELALIQQQQDFERIELHVQSQFKKLN